MGKYSEFKDLGSILEESGVILLKGRNFKIIIFGKQELVSEAR